MAILNYVAKRNIAATNAEKDIKLICDIEGLKSAQRNPYGMVPLPLLSDMVSNEIKNALSVNTKVIKFEWKKLVVLSK